METMVIRGWGSVVIAVLVGACDADPAGVDAPPAVDAPAASDAAPADAPPATIDPSLLVPGCFVGGEAPQLDLAAPVPGWTWNDPHVVASPDGYWMYASATDAFVFPVRLYRLTSPDGATWSAASVTLVLDVADAGAWDAGGVETPAVVAFAGAYHLFYTGYQTLPTDPAHTALEFRVGHAVATDGETFARVGPPVIAPSGDDADPTNDWYQFIVGEPAPVVRDGRLDLYFTAVGIDAGLASTLQVIGVVSTTDGVTWTAPQRVLAPDQAIYPRGEGWIGYSTPNAAVIGDDVHLFFDVAYQPTGDAPYQQLRVHHARSADGATGWIHDSLAIRAAGDHAWATEEARSPHALLDGTSLRLYFAGHELDGTPPDHFAIGMLTCDLTGAAP
ncbi:MAG: hypothetical protein R2939_10320 [Kofleriaceae bacterium]